jgi:hypothetical protein
LDLGIGAIANLRLQLAQASRSIAVTQIGGQG